MRQLAIANVLVLIAPFVFAVDATALENDTKQLDRLPFTVESIPLAVELNDGDKFKNMIGILTFDHGRTMSLVTFVRSPLNDEQMLPIAAVYTIALQSKGAAHSFYVEGINQYGVKLSGTIDVSVETKPSIALVLDTGLKIVNLGKSGREFQSKYIPNIDLGSQY